MVVDFFFFPDIIEGFCFPEGRGSIYTAFTLYADAVQFGVCLIVWTHVCILIIVTKIN